MSDDGQGRLAAVRGVRPRQARPQPRPRGLAARRRRPDGPHHARDLYTRRNEGVSIWVVRSGHIAASARDEKDPFFAPSGDKVYRHPTFYDIPDDVPHI